MAKEVFFGSMDFLPLVNRQESVTKRGIEGWGGEVGSAGCILPDNVRIVSHISKLGLSQWIPHTP
jgi:hypothetical protein